MAKFRKKPVVIEAFCWTGDENQAEDPVWIREAIERGDANIRSINAFGGPAPLMMIKTLEGVMVAHTGDYIIQGVKGEIYPCKPDIFEATYEAVTERPMQPEYMNGATGFPDRY